jgi:hypothetical protein
MAFAAGATRPARTRSGSARVYVVVAIWGFVVGDGDAILSIVPINTEDNVLHLLIGIAGLAAAAASTAARPGVESTV